jgi:Fe2+ or Zn2+ uptake regulation protein
MSARVLSVQQASDLRAHLRANGRKVTPQRELIASLLFDNSMHPTAEAIYELAVPVMPSLSLKTVYTVLAEFEELGEIRSVSVSGGPLRFDPNTSDHHHLVCRACGAVQDVTLDGPALRSSLPVEGGHVVERVDVVLYGLCATCSSQTLS